MAQSALEFDPGGRQEARGEQRSDGENGGCIRLAILLFPVNRLLDREVDFIIIFSSSFFFVPSNVRPLLVGLFFSVLAGACQLGTEWAGLRLFHHHHLLSYFLLCHKSISISSISPF